MLPFLNPRSPNSMLSLCHGILPKVVSALFTTLNSGGGEGETKFVLSIFNNFVILAITRNMGQDGDGHAHFDPIWRPNITINYMGVDQNIKF